MGYDMSAPSYIDVDGARVAYHRLGQGVPLLLIHGIPTSSYLWRDVIPPLVLDGLEIIAIDLFGYGDSDKPIGADLGVAAHAQRVAAVLHKLHWDAGTIAGHDIGGGVAQLVCANHPQAVRGLVLVDSIAYDSFPEPRIARLKDPVWDGILGAPGFDLRTGLTKGFTRAFTPEPTAAYVRPFHGVDGRLAYLRAARTFRTEELSARMVEIEKLDIPALIIWGSEDLFQPIHYGARLAAAMPRARFVKVERAGHFLPEDAPEALARLIAGFVKSIAGVQIVRDRQKDHVGRCAPRACP
jgi:pimeloyl-ACP methyl ester carboxylesterase